MNQLLQSQAPDTNQFEAICKSPVSRAGTALKPGFPGSGAHEQPWGGCLEGVCDLLRAHTKAGIRLENHKGRVLLEQFYEEHGLQNPHAPSTVSGESSAKNSIEVEFAKHKLILERDGDFTGDEKLAAEMVACICTVLIRHYEGVISAENKRRVQAVRAVINSLSFSELEAATHVFKEIVEIDKKSGNEGLLVAGRIADKLGFTRSVVTGALRKLEGSGLIETRSLGMKGTYIRVTDTLLTEELAKL